MPIPFETGALLEVRGERWLLTAAIPHGAFTLLTLQGHDPGNARRQLRVIDPFDRPRRVTASRPMRRPRRAVLRAALRAIVDARSAASLWTAADARIELLAYQLEPALAAIAGATRLLLADAVGLGKTIQAGLLLSELRERGWVERALIVCPAGLRETWARELRERFGIDASILDQAAIAERIATLPPGENPWSGYAVAVASIDFVKRAEVLAAIEHEPFDLLIADEAHHLTPGTDRGAAVSRLAARAPWCALLSATPHSGDEAAFDYLKNIGAHGEPIAIFRRSRADVGFSAPRRTHLLAITPTAAERALFAALDRYTRAIWRERGRDDPTTRLIAVTLARRAASSRDAITRSLERRRDLLIEPPAEPSQPRLPWMDDDESDQADGDGVLALPGLHDAVEERAALDELIRLAHRSGEGSKLLRLRRLLERVREPVVIFTEYRDSLDGLAGALGSQHRLAAIHGGVATDSRRSIVDAFNDGAVDVLLATDAAGEGLNLHHRCRLIVDLELPWNPLRLEQRVGRVDRIGQRRTVHAIRLFHANTIEQRVLDQLRLRDRRAGHALAPVTDAMVAGAIFDGTSIGGGAVAPLSGVRITADGELERIRRQRSVHAQVACATSGLSWTAPRRAATNRLMLVMRRSFVNDDGRLVHADVTAQTVTVAGVIDRRMWRWLLTRLRDRTVEHAKETPVPDLVSEIEIRRAGIRRRVAAIRAAAPVRREAQTSLFDRRSEHSLARAHEAIEARERALTRLLRAIAAPAARRTRIELIAAWPEARR